MLLAFPLFRRGRDAPIFNTATVIPTRRLRAPATPRARDLAIMAATFLFESMCLQTAFAPATMSVRELGRIYAHLLGLP
jgi:hypothetical protein